MIDANTLGDFVAAWAQDPSDTIAAVVKPSSGFPTAPQLYVGDFDDPDVAIGGNSVGLLAFEDDVGSTSIYAASKAPGSSVFTATTPFSGNGVGEPHNDPPSAAQPSVAVNHLGTGMLMFARDYYYPPNYSGIAEAIEGRILLDPAANAWNAGADINQRVYDPRNTEVSLGADGSAFLGINVFTVGPCWGLDTAVLENGGAGSTDPDHFALDCTAGSIKYAGINPSNNRLPNGDIVMAYAHSNNDSVNFLDLSKARAYAGTSNHEADAVRLDEVGGTQKATTEQVLVRTDAAGNAVVVWYDSASPGEDPESMLARYRPAGGAWGPLEVISSGEDYQGSPDFDMDDGGTGYLVYERKDAVSGDQQIVAAERAPGAGPSGWTTPELLSEGQTDVRLPQVAAAGNGQAFASWAANADRGVFYATIGTEPPVDPGPTDPGGTTPGNLPPALTPPGPGGNDNPAACKKAQGQLTKAKKKLKKLKERDAVPKTIKKARKAVKKAKGVVAKTCD